MKSVRAFLLVLAAVLAVLGAQASTVARTLDIPAREQWDNNNGYCGECCIQTCALYFGTYISQYACRAIIDPTQQQDVWIGGEEIPILNALRLTFDQWDSSQTTPQYQKQLAWMKNHLYNGHPAIFACYVQGGEDSDYDHIIPAVGFQSSFDATAYHTTDRLLFYDNYETSAFNRAFSTMFDTRSMKGNGKTYDYCIPTSIDYGVALTGIRDDAGVTVPVHLSVDRWNEPNVSKGASPVQMNAEITISSLQPGMPYTILRYDDYNKVPTQEFLASDHSSALTFYPDATTAVVGDHFMSNQTVIYRALPTLSEAQLGPAPVMQYP